MRQPCHPSYASLQSPLLHRTLNCEAPTGHDQDGNQTLNRDPESSESWKAVGKPYALKPKWCLALRQGEGQREGEGGGGEGEGGGGGGGAGASNLTQAFKVQTKPRKSVRNEFKASNALSIGW